MIDEQNKEDAIGGNLEYRIQNTGYGIRDTEANPTSVKR
jgi:hypothetical protein